MKFKRIGFALLAMLAKMAVGISAVLLLVYEILLIVGVNWESGPFPADIKIRRVIGSESFYYGRESCAVAVLELERQTVEQLNAQGSGFLTPLTQGRDGSQLSAWNVGPLNRARSRPKDDPLPVTADGKTLFAIPENGCHDDRVVDEKVFNELMAAMTRGEAYYATFNSGEGLLILAPRLKQAAFFYNG